MVQTFTLKIEFSILGDGTYKNPYRVAPGDHPYGLGFFVERNKVIQGFFQFELGIMVFAILSGNDWIISVINGEGDLELIRKRANEILCSGRNWGPYKFERKAQKRWWPFS